MGSRWNLFEPRRRKGNDNWNIYDMEKRIYLWVIRWVSRNKTTTYNNLTRHATSSYQQYSYQYSYQYQVLYGKYIIFVWLPFFPCLWLVCGLPLVFCVAPIFKCSNGATTTEHNKTTSYLVVLYLIQYINVIISPSQLFQAANNQSAKRTNERTCRF